MKRRVQTTLFIALLVPASLAQIKIDLKTPLPDKDKLKLAKAGLGAYLRQAEWVEVVNVGEDYSVWIKNLKRRFKGNLLEFKVDLELRTQADLGIGDSITARHIVDTVDLSEVAQLKTFEAREVYGLVEKQLLKNNKYKPISAVVGTATHMPFAGAVIEEGVKLVGIDLDETITPDQAVEAMTIGAVLMANLREMIDALPPLKKKKG